jgi:NADH-quinone oxidoreductase subunit M
MQTLILILLPLLSGVLMLLMPDRMARTGALLSSVVTLALTLMLAPAVQAGADLSFAYEWLPQLGAQFAGRLDGISYILVLLAALVMPFIVLTAHRQDYNNRFYALMLMMQAAMIGVFTATDGFLFYIFWELALIPIYFICLNWGGQNRGRITLKFFVYTLLGSLFMLVALIFLYFKTEGAHSFDITALTAAGQNLQPQEQTRVFWALFLAFGIKMPIFPLHTWQPDTYTTAPAPGTMLLSGVMLKMGTYGVIRWLIPIVPVGFRDNASIVVTLSVISIVYASIIAIQQTDFKRLVAYSSIAHVGLISAGMFTFGEEALQGALFQMLAHGISVVGLFFVIDLIEHRRGTRELSQLGGIRHVDARFAWLFLILVLGSVALPLTSGFVGEFLLLAGLVKYNVVLAGLGGLTVILGAVYMLRSYQSAMLGSPTDQPFAPLTATELGMLFGLATLTLLFGIVPQWILQLSALDVQNLVQQVAEALKQ